MWLFNIFFYFFVNNDSNENYWHCLQKNATDQKYCTFFYIQKKSTVFLLFLNEVYGDVRIAALVTTQQLSVAPYTPKANTRFFYIQQKACICACSCQ